MAKKLTLDETWKKCLAMWKWIAGQPVKKVAKEGVLAFKAKWMKLNGYGKGDILLHCFCCHYCGEVCPKCPGQKVDSKFDCTDEDYTYHEPVGFYNKIVELNKIRLSKKN